MNSTLAFVISRVLEFKEEKINCDEAALATLDQDTKTLLTLITAVHEEQSKTLPTPLLLQIGFNIYFIV